jgi:hypothetical protein
MLTPPAGGAVLTTSAVVAEWLRAPLVPVIVRVEVARGVLAAVVTVSVELFDPLIDGGENDPVVFAGRPVTPRLTLPANPFNAVVVTV